MKWPTITRVEGQNPWVTYAKRQVTVKNNCINLMVTSPPGMGKSWGLLSYFYIIDPDFDMQERCLFGVLPLIKYFKKAKEEYIKGKPIMYDESGVESHALNYRDELNVGLNMFLQTGRSLNYIFGMTVPFVSFVSKGVRTLMNCHFRANGWNSKNESIFKPLVTEWNDVQQKFYNKRLLVRDNGKITYCNEILIPKLPTKILNEYEKLKKEFQDKLYGDIIGKIESRDIKKEESKLVKCYKVAGKLGVSTHTILNWVNKGEIKARQIGKFWFMTTEQSEKLLNKPTLLGNGGK